MKLKSLLFLTVAIAVGAAVLGSLHYRKPPLVSANRKVIVDIGAYPTVQAEQRVALQRLSAELGQHPEANAVRITAGKSSWRQGVMGFIRSSSPGNKNLFWYDDRFSSPNFGYVNGRQQGIGVVGLVSEKPIHVVAQRSGTAFDVLSYNQQLRVQLGIDKPVTPIKTLPRQHGRT